jgi:hypothetical protein
VSWKLKLKCVIGISNLAKAGLNPFYLDVDHGEVKQKETLYSQTTVKNKTK